MSYKKIDLTKCSIEKTIGETLQTFANIGSMKASFPLFVRLVENPKFSVWDRNVFLIPGAVDPILHDCLHIVLGRSFLPSDEAFVIGFTMGSTQKMNAVNSGLYIWIVRLLYPKAYRFDVVEEKVFRRAVRIGREIASVDYSQLDRSDLQSMTIECARDWLISDWQKLLSEYKLEIESDPSKIESIRLQNLVCASTKL